jgi:hypothetical protein
MTRNKGMICTETVSLNIYAYKEHENDGQHANDDRYRYPSSHDYLPSANGFAPDSTGSQGTRAFWSLSTM